MALATVASWCQPANEHPVLSQLQHFQDHHKHDDHKPEILHFLSYMIKKVS
jgi:hypothetical protein